jgi:hypothetical protein
MNDLAVCISQITPEDCPDDALRMKASKAAATVIEANIAEFRGPTMALDVATAGREIRNKWYAEHGSTNQRS